jgi:hypothetical protein
MNAKQQDVINDLENAFAKAKSSGLVLCSMDGDLIAYDKDSVDKLLADGKSLYDAQVALNTACEEVSVYTNGTFLDSGGW